MPVLFEALSGDQPLAVDRSASALRRIRARGHAVAELEAPRGQRDPRVQRVIVAVLAELQERGERAAAFRP